MRIEEYPYPVRAWVGRGQVARSDSCLCLERDGEPPAPYISLADIDLSRFRDAGHGGSADPAGESRSLRIDSPGEALLGSGAEPVSSEHGSETLGADGNDVLRIVTAPLEGLHELAGDGTLDPRRVRVEVADGPPNQSWSSASPPGAMAPT